MSEPETTVLSCLGCKRMIVVTDTRSDVSSRAPTEENTQAQMLPTVCHKCLDANEDLRSVKHITMESFGRAHAAELDIVARVLSSDVNVHARVEGNGLVCFVMPVATIANKLENGHTAKGLDSSGMVDMYNDFIASRAV